MIRFIDEEQGTGLDLVADELDQARRADHEREAHGGDTERD